MGTAPQPPSNLGMFAWVTSQYGATMLCVQTFEGSLANLVAVVEASKHTTSGPGGRGYRFQCN